MRVPAITFGLIVALVLAFGAVWFTGCAHETVTRRFTCAETGTVAYEDEEGASHTVTLFACEG